MKKNIIGFGLLVFAVGSIVPMTIINRHYVEEKNGSTDGYWQSTAKNVDIWANKEFRATWNARLVQAIEVDGVITYPYKFGIDGETISEALQRNYELGTLTKRGQKLYNIINRIDPGHFNEL